MSPLVFGLLTFAVLAILFLIQAVKALHERVLALEALMFEGEEPDPEKQPGEVVDMDARRKREVA